MELEKQMLLGDNMLKKGLETANIKFDDLFNDAANMHFTTEGHKSISLAGTPTLKEFEAMMDKTLSQDQEEEKKGEVDEAEQMFVRMSMMKKPGGFKPKAMGQIDSSARCFDNIEDDVSEQFGYKMLNRYQPEARLS